MAIAVIYLVEKQLRYFPFLLLILKLDESVRK